MHINFNRNRVQEYLENSINEYEQLNSKDRKHVWKQLTLTHTQVADLQPLIKLDAIDYMFNSILSFCEAIDGVFEKRYSWATIKLYYSIFYALRSHMAIDSYSIINASGISRLKIYPGESPTVVGNHNDKSTHGATIHHYIALFRTSDVLLSNNIDDMNSYEWYKNIREIINYRSVHFCEPNDPVNIWAKIDKSIDSNEFSSLLSLLEGDSSFRYTFQSEYAVIAIPLLKIKSLLKAAFDKRLIDDTISDRISYMKRILKYSNRDLNLLNDIFGITQD